MTSTSPHHPSHRPGAALLGALVALTGLLACGDDLTLTDDRLPAPAVSFGTPVPTCDAPTGTASLGFTDTGTAVTIAFPASIPINRVDVRGEVAGLGTETVFVALTPLDEACPLVSTATAVVSGDGFTARIDTRQEVEFRLTAVAFDGAASDLGCDAAAGCLTVATGAPAAVAPSLRVVLE